MTDPNRLLTGGATEFERYLLGAAARERPTRWQRQRMRRGIILAELGMMGTVVNALASVTEQIVVVSVIAGALAGQGSAPPSALPRQARAPVAHRAEVTSASAQTDRNLTNELVTKGIETKDETPRASKADLTPSKVEVASVPTVIPRRSTELREEIALMDQARTALRSGATQSALGSLEQYRTRFPRGSFNQEAQALRIEALAANGNQARALSLAKEFLAHYPNSPHSARLRRIVASSTTESR